MLLAAGLFFLFENKQRETGQIEIFHRYWRLPVYVFMMRRSRCCCYLPNSDGESFLIIQSIPESITPKIVKMPPRIAQIEAVNSRKVLRFFSSKVAWIGESS